MEIVTLLIIGLWVFLALPCILSACATEGIDNKETKEQGGKDNELQK